MSNFHVICINETYLDNSIHNDSVAIDGFHPPLTKDRNRRGGAVAIYISSSDWVLIYYQIDILNTVNCSFVSS